MIEHIFADKTLDTEVSKIFEEVLLNRLQQKNDNICGSNRLTGNIYFLAFTIAEKGFQFALFCNISAFLGMFSMKVKR